MPLQLAHSPQPHIQCCTPLCISISIAHQTLLLLCSKTDPEWPAAARDTHMADTAGMLVDHLKTRGIDRPKIVICAHVWT